MDILQNLQYGFQVALSPINLLYCVIGVTLGTLIGVLPGIGPLVAISILLPITFGLSPEGSIIMLAGIYYGAAYGGSTTAILVNLPGEPSSVVTCIDGHQMARQGRAGPALAIAAISSLIAGFFGTILIAVCGPPLSEFTLQFGPTDYFALVLLALALTAVLIEGSLLQGVTMAFVGVLVGLIGPDVNSGAQRFTFGFLGLYDGLDFVVVAVGLYALTEIVTNLERPEQRHILKTKVTALMPNLADFKASATAILRGTAIGTFFGLLPGTGQTISSFSAYMVEKRVSRNRAQFGHGAIEGVAAPEAANNAAAQASFIPTLTLGVPGSATMALFLGALMIHGITPGPGVMAKEPELFWGLIASMFIGNALLVVINLPLIPLWVRLLQIPYRWLYPGILMFSCIGAYSLASSTFDVLLTAGFGLLGYVFLKLGCSVTPFVLGVILGPILEVNFRRALLLSRGDPTTFFVHPISAVLLAALVVVLIAFALPSVRRRKEAALAEGGE